MADIRAAREVRLEPSGRFTVTLREDDRPAEKRDRRRLDGPARDGG